MKACFADNADLPISCAHDIDEVYNCSLASQGILRKDCHQWDVVRAIDLCSDILGEHYTIKPTGSF